MSTLRSYGFFKNKGGTTPPGFDLGEFDHDTQARVHPILMLTGGQYDSIQVWDGFGEPFTVEPPPAIVSPESSASSPCSGGAAQ